MLQLSYDSLARVQGRSYTVNGNAVYSYTLTRDRAGRVTQKTETVQGIESTTVYAYDADGQLLNGTMMDYLVPMAGEMPDIEVAHVQTITDSSELGAKGAGEAGTAGAPAAVMNALNDALAPLGARLTAMPFTPERVLRALGRVGGAGSPQA